MMFCCYGSTIRMPRVAKPIRQQRRKVHTQLLDTKNNIVPWQRDSIVFFSMYVIFPELLIFPAKTLLPGNTGYRAISTYI